MLPYIAEFLGTMILIILGDGVVANVTLNKSGMKGAGSVQITFAWGFAVLVPAFIFGAASGAHFNPALTIALASIGKFQWSLVPGYIIAQIAGAFVGGIFVYILFKGQFDATEEPATKRGVFCTAPSVPNTVLNLFSEIIGTFILVFAILGINNVENVDLNSYNADYRVMLDRWQNVGDLTPLKSLKDRYQITRPTSRFIQKNNHVDFNSLSLSYDFNRGLINRIGLNTLKLQFNMKDIDTWSTIKQEMGLSYPFARTFVFTLNASF